MTYVVGASPIMMTWPPRGSIKGAVEERKKAPLRRAERDLSISQRLPLVGAPVPRSDAGDASVCIHSLAAPRDARTCDWQTSRPHSSAVRLLLCNIVKQHLRAMPTERRARQAISRPQAGADDPSTASQKGDVCDSKHQNIPSSPSAHTISRVFGLAETLELTSSTPAAPARPLEPIADPARLLYRAAILDSIANVECTMKVYDTLVSAQTQAPPNSKNVNRYSVEQTRAYRSKLEFRRDQLLGQLKGVPVDASLVNKMMEVAFTGSKDQLLEAVEYYGDMIAKANQLLQQGSYGEREMAHLKVLWDCMCILLERYSAFESHGETRSIEHQDGDWLHWRSVGHWRRAHALGMLDDTTQLSCQADYCP